MKITSTRIGIWRNGVRIEESWKRVRFGEPYKACMNLRKAIAGRKDFDPVTLFIWRTMAKGVLKILKKFSFSGHT